MNAIRQKRLVPTAAIEGPSIVNLLSTIARMSGLGSAALLFAQCPLAVAAEPASDAATISVYATGFNNPRGLKFDAAGQLYVAEGGVGGSESTVGICTQVVPPVGPYTGSSTGGRISRVGPWGYRDTVTDNLPSNNSSPGNGSVVLGVADVAFVGPNLFGLLGGAGCSHGVARIPNGVVKIAPRGDRWSLVADLSAFQQAHPTAHENPADFEPDGVWYSMVEVDGALYAIEPNHGELDRIDLDGHVTRIADISATQGHVVPTALAWHDGAFYVGELSIYPIVAGAANVLRITMRGDVEVAATGFSDITGLAFGAQGEMYVLENTTGNPFPTPNTGDVVRVAARSPHDVPGLDAPARRGGDVIASGLLLPTAMTYHDGSLYVSVGGFGLPATGLGEVLKIRLHHEDKGW